MRSPPFNFYEVVSIGEHESVPVTIRGKMGAVMDMTLDKMGLWRFSIHIFDESIRERWTLLEKDLASNGVQLARRDLDGGTATRIEPERDDGRSDWN